MKMFSSLRLSNLRNRSKNSCGSNGPTVNNNSASQQDLTTKPPHTPLNRRPSRCGVDRGMCPSIGSLRHGSLAQRSDALCPGDRVTAVNGIRTGDLQHGELVALLRNVQGCTVLDIEYPLPDCAPEAAPGFSARVCTVGLVRAAGSLGFTLRGGAQSDPQLSRPLVVTHVRPGGPADREGSLQAGDRLVSVDGVSLRGASLTDAQALLHGTAPHVVLGVEYEVSVLEAVRQATGALLVEVVRPAGRDLGVMLAVAGCGVIIDSIQPASIAERCGALHVGDQVLAVGDLRVDGPGASAAEVAQLLRGAQGGVVTLEILPLSQTNCGWRLSDNRVLLGPKCSPLYPSSSSPSPSGFGTLNSRHRQRGRFRSALYDSSLLSGSAVGCDGVCHMETLLITLQADQHGYGLSVQDMEERSTVLVAGVEMGGPADRCGCIQVGDRVLAVNGHSVALEHMTAADIERLLQDDVQLQLQLEFDVADSVVPSSGIFSVKLAKRGNGLGITITASKNRLPGEPLLISDIRCGSVAHRTGTLQPGDRLLAIDSLRLDQCSLEDTQQILQGSANIVTLRVQKDDSFSEAPDSKTVVYTVELIRHGGPLGITVAGSEEPFEPITISGLTNGGLAQQTGALHIGDRLLAIGGECLQGKPLSEAIALLQNSGDIVTLKIARKIADMCAAESPNEPVLTAGQFGPALPSVDSAVESWDSSMVGHTPPVTEGYQTESATVKRKHKAEPELLHWDGLSRSTRSVDSGNSGALSEEDAKKTQTIGLDSIFLEPDLQLSRLEPQCSYYSPPASPLPLPHYLRCTINGSLPRCHRTEEEGCDSAGHLASPGSASPQQLEFYQVTLFKDPVYEDFGFSVSDGLYERGVYINRVRKGGPADLSTKLKPYDRILQVNDTRTHDFDCCLTVPLIASAGEKLELTVARNPYSSSYDVKNGSGGLPWVEEEESLPSLQPAGTVTKTL